MVKQAYIVKKAFPHRGEIIRPGDKVELHPRQAQYLIGTHLERPAARKGKAAPAKKAEVTGNE